jgi:MFS family permease
MAIVAERATRVAARPPASRTAKPVRWHGDREAQLIVWGAWLTVMAGVNLATPLYGVYAERFGFSSLVLTLIFAVYALVLIPTLLAFGRLSDRFGRRPVMLAGMAAAGLGLILFATAQGVAWLFAARIQQGIAVGTISGAATAALVELDPEGGRMPALLAGLAQAGGNAVGPLLAGVLAEWAPAPQQLTYLALLASTLAAAVVVLLVDEPGVRGSEPWQVQVPRVPRAVRDDFVRVSTTAATVWAAVALYLSIGPSYVSELLPTDNLALLGATAAVPLAVSCLVQAGAGRLALLARPGQGVGLTLLVAGLLALVAASPMHSLPVLLVAAVLTGAGHGLAFVHAQDELNGLAPAERRGEVTAAFISCIYLVVGAAVVATGVLALGLALSAAVTVVALVLALVAALTAAWQLDLISPERVRRSRPRARARSAVARVRR